MRSRVTPVYTSLERCASRSGMPLCAAVRDTDQIARIRRSSEQRQHSSHQRRQSSPPSFTRAPLSAADEACPMPVVGKLTFHAHEKADGEEERQHCTTHPEENPPTDRAKLAADPHNTRLNARVIARTK